MSDQPQRVAIVTGASRAIGAAIVRRLLLTSGIVGANSGLLGEPYIDSADHRYHALVVQPLIVLSAGRDLIKTTDRAKLVV